MYMQDIDIICEDVHRYEYIPFIAELDLFSDWVSSPMLPPSLVLLSLGPEVLASGGVVVVVVLVVGCVDRGVAEVDDDAGVAALVVAGVVVGGGLVMEVQLD